MKRGLRLIKKLPFNSLMFLVFIGIGTVAYIRPSRFINQLFIMMSITLLLDGIYFFLVIRYLKVNVHAPKTIQKDERFTLKIDMINRAPLPSPYIYIKPKDGIRFTLEKKQALMIMLEARQFKAQELPCNAQFYGKEQVVLEEVSMRSFIGFFRKSLTQNISTTIKILPTIKHLEYMQHFNDFLMRLNRQEDKQNEQANNESIGDEIGYELSPYIEGDSQRLIHWKIVASRDEYLVRQREEKKEWERDLFFILNPLMQYQSNDEQVVIQDKIVTTLISLVAYYINQGQKVKVTYYKHRKWEYIKIRETKDIYFLQDTLSDYEGLRVERQSNVHEMIKGLLKLTQKKSGYKLIISSYWEENLEKYILENRFQTKEIPMIWTGGAVPNYLVHKVAFSIWHMTDHYELVLCTEEKLGRIEAIDGMY